MLELANRVSTMRASARSGAARAPGRRCRCARRPGPAPPTGAATRRRRRVRSARWRPEPTTGCPRRRRPATAPGAHAPSSASTAPSSSSTTADHSAPTARRACCDDRVARARRGRSRRRGAAAVSSASSRGSWSGVGDRPHLLDVDAVDLWTSSTSRSIERPRRAGRPPARRWPAGASLEDLDADDLAAHRTDPAGHLPERTGTVGQPQADDDGLHAEATYGGPCEPGVSCRDGRRERRRSRPRS